MSNSLKELVEKYGFGIEVTSSDPNILPFKVLGPIGTGFYKVELIQSGRKAHLPRYNKYLPNCFIIQGGDNDKARVL